MIEFVAERLPELMLQLGQHIILTGTATMAAVLIGVPLGILAFKKRGLRGVVLGTVSITQTIPSLAMLAILLALMGKIGWQPAVIALTLYALLPIVRNTVTGLEGVSPGIMEAARGIGMTDMEELVMVRLPLARPVIISGIRTAAIISVGVATLSAYIGSGGLGDFIVRGLSLLNTPLIMLGAVPAAMLAILVDYSIGAAEWGLRPLRSSDRNTPWARLRPLALLLPFLLLAIGVVARVTGPSPDLSGQKTLIRVASKDFTEQLIVGELMAQLIEADPAYAVDRKFDLGGTMICHRALVEGEVDLYAEYTGTGLIAVLKRDVVSDPNEVLKIVRRGYAKKFSLVWLEPFGFNNTYAITVRAKDAAENGWANVSDLAAAAKRLRAGFTAEFVERGDGYPGLRKAYGFGFGTVKDLSPAIMYSAISMDEVDVICAFATDGRIAAFNLKPLVDNLNYFPPYYAAPVVRRDTLAANPGLKKVLAPLGGLLDDAEMQKLNYDVDKNKRKPADVAREFLQEKGLVR